MAASVAEVRPGPAGLATDPGAVSPARAAGPARVCIASYEFVGPTRTGGIGTAYTSLAEALAEAGHSVTVLFTGWRDPRDDRWAQWAEHYDALGIELDRLESFSEHIEAGQINAGRAYDAYRWLRERDAGAPFDVIHFPETLGHGYYAILAKRQGLAFERTTIAVGTHSSTSWVLEIQGVVCQGPNDYADDFLERQCVAGADVVISPSAYMLDWMRSHGWQLPERHFVQPYVLPSSLREVAGKQPVGVDGRDPTEVVFFGRLEHRKGLRLFCDALDELAASEPADRFEVTLLGRQALIDGELAGRYVEKRARNWPWSWRIVDDLGQREAIAHLRAPGRRLAVMPSLADNSPNTVYEALALGIPFIASSAGGTAELIHPGDLDRCTFDPSVPAALAARIRDALSAPRLEPVRPAIDPEENRRAYVDWHSAVAVRQPATDARAAGPAAPDRGRAEIVGVGESGPAAALDAVDRDADYLLFVPAGAALADRAVETLVDAAEHGGAGIVAPAVLIDDPEQEELRIRVPVGGPAIAGLLRRPFGDLAWLARRSTVAELGAFDRAVHPRWQSHELLCRAAIAGVRIEPVPEPLVGPLSEEEAGELEVIGEREPAAAIARDFRAAPELLAELPGLAQQLFTIQRIFERQFEQLYLHRFGRLTLPIRWLLYQLRRARDYLRRAGRLLGARRSR